MPRQLLKTKPKRIIRFMGPYNKKRDSFMEISNPTMDNIGWRLVTTAPFRYTVTPRAGIIPAKCVADIRLSIRYQYVHYEMQDDKFKLQNFLLPKNNMDAASIWRNLNPKILMQSRFIVYFDMPTMVLKPHNIHYDKTAPLPKLWLAPGARLFRARNPPPKPPKKKVDNIPKYIVKSELEPYPYEIVHFENFMNPSFNCLYIEPINMIQDMIYPCDIIEASIYIFTILLATLLFSYCSLM